MVDWRLNIKLLYENYPYPAVEPYVSRLDSLSLSYFNSNRFVDPVEVLVVGCGTVEPVIAKNHFVNGHVKGIDVSRQSLEILGKVIESNNVGGVECVEHDITNPIDDKFDVVIASGVLHHIPEVDKAVRNIRDSLKDNGMFFGMVYGTSGREHIVKTREEYGFDLLEPTDENISRVRFVLSTLPDNHPSRMWYAQYNQSDEEVADTWLNPYFVNYTVEMVQDLFNRNDMIVNVTDNGTKLSFTASRCGAELKLTLAV